MARSRLLGLDPGSRMGGHCGYSLWEEGEKVESGVIGSVETAWTDRVNHICAQVADLLSGVTDVMIERPMYVHNQATYGQQCMLIGRLWQMCVDAGARVWMLYPNQIRKSACGSGKIKAEEVRQYLLDHGYTLQTNSLDESDAVAAGLAGVNVSH